MNNFWLVVALSLLASVVYIWQSVTTQVAKSDQSELPSENASGPTHKKLIAMGLMILALFSIPLGYYWLGNYDKQLAWQAAQQRFSAVQQGSEFNPEQNGIQDMVLSLRTAVDKDPNNGQLWFMLAEVYFQLRMTDLADAALTRALRLELRPDWLVANAQVLTARGDESDMARAEYLLTQAVQIQPTHQSALLTLGFVQLRQQKLKLAINSWQQLKRVLEESGNDTARIQKQIDLIKQELAQKSQ